MQIAGSGQATTGTTAVAQTAVNTATTTVVPQAASLGSSVTTTTNQIGVANGNIVMVRNDSDVRTINH